jgi:hypothetical protein
MIKELFDTCLLELNEAERKELVVLLVASMLNPKPTKNLGVDLIRYAERCNKEWVEAGECNQL